MQHSKRQITTLYDNFNSANVLLVIAAIAFIQLFFLTIGSKSQYIYDESYYIAGPNLLVQGTSFRDFLLAPLSTPAGPLYAVIHWLTAPLTHLAPPAIRLPNLLLLVVGFVAIGYTLDRWGLESPWARAAMLLGVPIFWVSAGMALTEMPAFAFASLAVAATTWAMTAPQQRSTRVWLGFVLAGCALGIAVLGRQPYLPAAGGFILIGLLEPRFRWPAWLSAIIAGAIPLPIFLLWGGLVPPHVAFVSGGLNLNYGLRGYAYMAFLVLLLAPRFYLASWRTCVAGWILATLVIFATGLGSGFTVASGTAERLPGAAGPLFQEIVPSLFLALGICLIIATVVNLWARREERLWALTMLLTLGLAATPAAIIHLFSSRYLMATFPFAILAVQPYFVPNRWAVVRLAGGAAFGYASLAAYLHLPVPA